MEQIYLKLKCKVFSLGCSGHGAQFVSLRRPRNVFACIRVYMLYAYAFDVIIYCYLPAIISAGRILQSFLYLHSCLEVDKNITHPDEYGKYSTIKTKIRPHYLHKYYRFPTILCHLFYLSVGRLTHRAKPNTQFVDFSNWISWIKVWSLFGHPPRKGAHRKLNVD